MNCHREIALHRNLDWLCKSTGYTMKQVNGQRCWSPPTYWNIEKPLKHSEIFVGNLPRFIQEDELVPLFRKAGQIYQFRLMIDFSGFSRGYAFVRYTHPVSAQNAIKMFNNYEIRPGIKIGVYTSLDNTKLFVGKIPKDKIEKEIKEALNCYVQKITNVIMYPEFDKKDNISNRNRGYAFVEFVCHKDAAVARKILRSGIQLWDSTISCDWALPEPKVDPEIMNRITVIYLRNLPHSLSERMLWHFVQHYVHPYFICRIYKKADYAFVHCPCRISAEFIFETLQGVMVEGKTLQVAWARPQAYSKNCMTNQPPNHFCLSVPYKRRKMVLAMKDYILTNQMGNVEFGDNNNNPKHFLELSSEQQTVMKDKFN